MSKEAVAILAGALLLAWWILREDEPATVAEETTDAPDGAPPIDEHGRTQPSVTLSASDAATLPEASLSGVAPRVQLGTTLRPTVQMQGGGMLPTVTL